MRLYRAGAPPRADPSLWVPLPRSAERINVHRRSDGSGMMFLWNELTVEGGRRLEVEGRLEHCGGMARRYRRQRQRGRRHVRPADRAAIEPPRLASQRPKRKRRSWSVLPCFGKGPPATA